MNFEWDSEKYKENIAKHGIAFEYATLVFDDPHNIKRIDDRRDYKEIRCQTIGNTGKHILFIVWTLRDGDIRIISARKANKKEQRIYNNEDY